MSSKTKGVPFSSKLIKGMGGLLMESTTDISAREAPDASAVLELSSTTQGFLPPRMTTLQKLAIVDPEEGLVVYSYTDHKLHVFTGTVWETITSVP